MAPPFQRADPIDRFLEKVAIAADCWLWQGATVKGGYGRFRDGNDRIVYAHRFAWEAFVDAIPAGMDLDHVYDAGCRNRACVNPDHLEPVTHLENVRRGAHRRKTHCPHGHLYTDDNTVRTREGWRSCRECSREAVRRYRARRKAA